ncbi:MAG: flagellar biosynthetic protein FliR [Deltaproteobacteria bacterium RIFOXYD12_FULL_50_9]|nr:MAG: flagellar biosynthetic protein FliR [Deltaproteobacteria bacterium RIFOXYD12_FULL_50_9]
MPEAALLNWTLKQFLCLVIIMTRVGPLLFFLPVLGSRNVPVQTKLLFTVMVSLTLTPIVPINPADLPTSAVGFALFAASEVVFAGILSVFARLIFAAVETAGQMVGIQMGLGMAGTMDPEFGGQVSLIGQFWGVLAILLFLSIDGHHLFFRALYESFIWVRPGHLHITQATYEGMMQGAAYMFVLSVKIMAPACAALFFVQVGMGIIAKTVPQIPILIVGLPLNIAIGLIFAGLSLGYFAPLMINNFIMLGQLLPKLVKGLGG